ncbi:MAG: phage portal protein [Patescibacteria group bacterium]
MKLLRKLRDIADVVTGKRYNDVFKLGGEYTSFQLRNMSRREYLDEYKGWVFRAVSTIASKTASLNFHLVDPKSGKQLEHEYLALVKYDLLESVASFIKLNGSCYVWKNTVGGKVRSLHVLRPDLVTFEYDDKWSRISAYKYQVKNQTLRFKPEEILAFNNFNPTQAFPFVNQGVGDVQAASVAIDTDNAAAVWNWKFFENSARPGMVLESEKPITPEARERITETWNAKFKNVNNAHKLVILDGGLKASNLSPTQKDMDFAEGRRLSRDEILAIFGVPKAVIGLGEGVNVGNVKAFNTVFAEQTIQPLAIKIQEVLNAGLFNGLGYFEFINVIPYDDEETRKDFDSGFITVNEIRATRGLKPVKGGDTMKQTGQPQVSAPDAAPTKSGGDFASKVSEIVRKSVKGTEEYAKARWEKRNARLAKHQEKLSGILKGIFDKQEADVMSRVTKAATPDVPTLDPTKYQVIYLSLLKDAYAEIFDEEGQAAAEEVSAGFAFRVGDPAVTKLIRESIRTLGK